MLQEAGVIKQQVLNKDKEIANWKIEGLFVLHVNLKFQRFAKNGLTPDDFTIDSIILVDFNR